MNKREIKSQYWGVYQSRNGTFEAQIYTNGKRIYLGKGKDQLKLAILYDNAVKEYGLDKKLNFPIYPENKIPNTKQIQLTQGYFAIVDKEDFERVSQFNWSVKKWYRGGKELIYVHRGEKAEVNGKKININTSLHREILNITDPDIHIDHWDHNGLNCTKGNLRICTRSQNCENKLKDYNSAGNYKGVCKIKEKELYQVEIRPKGKRFYLGTFHNEIEGAKAYDMAAIKHFGEFACLNFPELINEYKLLLTV